MKYKIGDAFLLRVEVAEVDERDDNFHYPCYLVTSHRDEIINWVSEESLDSSLKVSRNFSPGGFYWAQPRWDSRPVVVRCAKRRGGPVFFLANDLVARYSVSDFEWIDDELPPPTVDTEKSSG